MAFIAQLYGDEVAPFLPEHILCLQLYQPLENYMPDEAPGELSPLVVTIPRGAPLSSGRSGVANPHALLRDIIWEDDVEPDWIDVARDDERIGLYLQTKLGGAAPDEQVLRSGQYVGMVAARGEGFNFGVPYLVLLQRAGAYRLALASDEEL